MKLISEFNDRGLEVSITEGKNGQKKYNIQGIFAQAEGKNRNGRIYPMQVMEKAVGIRSLVLIQQMASRLMREIFYL